MPKKTIKNKAKKSVHKTNNLKTDNLKNNNLKNNKKDNIFKYYPDDFGKINVKVTHMDLDFDIYDDHTQVKSVLHATTLGRISSLELNAKNLEIISIKCRQSDIKFSYDSENSKITITFDKPVEKGTNLEIESVTICKPTANILEGIYFDYTPKGCPPTQITQCQQWGFQMIVPCVDDMTAKCTYRTKITADSRYTNMISNGDVIVPRKSAGKGRDTITYDNSITPMAPYLFFLCVGTYSTSVREFEYPDGYKFKLELLAPLGSDKSAAEKALIILHEAIMWIYLYCGEEMHRKLDVRNQMWKLFLESQETKSEKRKNEIRSELKSLLARIIPGYKYTGSVYREIGMQNSNFGGMENVGNTTITANRLMPVKDTTDGSFEYMIRVKLHEFYHNINGSEVTGFSPFEIWLNEAVTVHVEQQYHEFLYGEEYSRLLTTLGIVSPDGGTIMQDENPTSLPIQPAGFNDPNDLITGVTYVKGPEFVKMIETIMGKEKFSVGLDLYHKRYSHNNATTYDWIRCMEEASGKKFMGMAKSWLENRWFPVVDVKSSYMKKEKKFVLNLSQSPSMKNSASKSSLWEFPFSVSILDNKGLELGSKNMIVSKKTERIIFENVEEPYYVSLNKGLSFFGRVVYPITREQMIFGARYDIDPLNSVLAFNMATDQEKIILIEKKKLNADVSVDPVLVDIFFEKLSDKKSTEKMGGLLCTIFESVNDKKYAHMYRKLYDARKQISIAIARKYSVEIKKLYYEYKKMIDDSKKPYVQRMIYQMKVRGAKNTCLALLAKLDTPEIHSMIKKQFTETESASDRIVAFSLYINSTAKDKMKLIKDFMETSKKNPVSWEVFLSAIGGNDSDDSIEIMKMVETSQSFNITQSNDQRALFGRFAYNKKKSLQTESGLRYLIDTLKKLGKINEYSACGILNVFGFVDLMEEEYHIPIISALLEIKSSLNVKETPSLYNSIRMILRSSDKARKRYEKINGKITD